MIRKFINYSLLIFAFFLAGIFIIYFSKVYLIKEPIIIDNYFSKDKKKIQSFLANKININENQIIIEDVGLAINDLQNFLSIKISNLEIISELNETILKSNKINIKLSLLDLIEGFTNNQLLIKNIFIDKIQFEFLKNQNFKIISSSILSFFRKVEYNSNFFNNLKINQLNLKFIETTKIKSFNSHMVTIILLLRKLRYKNYLLVICPLNKYINIFRCLIIQKILLSDSVKKLT